MKGERLNVAKIIDTFKPGSWEHEQLRIAAEMLTEKSPKGYKYYVGETYFDLGQGRLWTTILRERGGSYWVFQAITPEQQEEIIFSKDLDATTDSLIYWKNVG